MIIKVLGPGCTNCKNLERATKQAIVELGSDATIEKVEDYPTIMGYGVMSTPGVVINGKVVHAGGIPSRDKIERWLAAGV